jgi:hypothetical protein
LPLFLLVFGHGAWSPKVERGTPGAQPRSESKRTYLECASVDGYEDRGRPRESSAGRRGSAAGQTEVCWATLGGDEAGPAIAAFECDDSSPEPRRSTKVAWGRQRRKRDLLTNRGVVRYLIVDVSLANEMEALGERSAPLAESASGVSASHPVIALHRSSPAMGTSQIISICDVAYSSCDCLETVSRPLARLSALPIHRIRPTLYHRPAFPRRALVHIVRTNRTHPEGGPTLKRPVSATRRYAATRAAPVMSFWKAEMTMDRP